MKKKCWKKRAALVYSIAALAAGTVSSPVWADTYDAELSGNFMPGYRITAQIPESAAGNGFEGTYKWYRTRLSGSQGPEVLEEGEQHGRFSTYEITGEDVGWCIGFSAEGEGNYMGDYVGSFSYYVYPLIQVELSPDEYGHPGYVATVSTPGYDVETTDNWLLFTCDWYTGDSRDGDYTWYSGDETTETRYRLVLPDDTEARYLKVQVTLDCGGSTQETVAVVELPERDSGGTGDGGDGAGDGNGVIGDGGDGSDGGSGTTGDGSDGSEGGNGTTGDSGGGSGNGGVIGGEDGSPDGSDHDPDQGESSGNMPGLPEKPQEPDTPGTMVQPATPSDAQQPPREDFGNGEEEGKPAVPPSHENVDGGSREDTSGSDDQEPGKQPATPSDGNKTTSGGGSSRRSHSSGGNGGPAEAAAPVRPELVPSEENREQLGIFPVPEAGASAERLPKTGDDRNTELYRIVFAVSLMSLVLMVLNGQNVREHGGQEKGRKRKRMFLSPEQRLYRSGRMGKEQQ